MEEASCDRAAYVSNYQKNTGAFQVIQGPAARIRPSRLPEDFYSCEFPLSTLRRPLFPGDTAPLSVSLFVSTAANLILFFSPSVDYAGLVKNLSVSQVFQI